MEYPSRSIQAVVDEFARLPGIGRKTALRLALHLLKGTDAHAERLGQAITALRQNTRRCTTCNHLTDAERCIVCLNPRRDAHLVCVVEETQDLLAIEKTGHYHGTYHVLGGIISPMEGIGPSQLAIEGLLARAALGLTEIIFALPATMEGETTTFYIARRLEGLPIHLSNLARGIPVGGELEFADELTLSRSIQARTPYHNPLVVEAR
jgi:recombination protein RecR